MRKNKIRKGNLFKRSSAHIKKIWKSIGTGYKVIVIVVTLYGFYTIWNNYYINWYHQCFYSKYKKTLDDIYNNSAISKKDTLLIPLKKIKGKQCFNDAYKFYKGLCHTLSDETDFLDKDTDPEVLLSSIPKDSEYYDNSKIVLFKYYYTLYKDGTVDNYFFQEKISKIINYMNNDYKKGHAYYYLLSNIYLIDGQFSISHIYSVYNDMQKALKIRYEPEYNRHSTATLSEFPSEKDLNKHIINFRNKLFAESLIQFNLIFSILSREPLNVKELTIQNSLSRLVLFETHEEYEKYYQDLSVSFMFYTKIPSELIYLESIEKIQFLQKKFYPNNINIAKLEENCPLQYVVEKIINSEFYDPQKELQEQFHLLFQ